MTALVFVDTNVLLYRHDTARPEKQEAAEIRRRRSELRSGAVRAVPWDQARARLNAL